MEVRLPVPGLADVNRFDVGEEKVPVLVPELEVGNEPLPRALPQLHEGVELRDERGEQAEDLRPDVVGAHEARRELVIPF